jgi:hypothetical protein
LNRCFDAAYNIAAAILYRHGRNIRQIIGGKDAELP